MKNSHTHNSLRASNRATVTATWMSNSELWTAPKVWRGWSSWRKTVFTPSAAAYWLFKPDLVSSVKIFLWTCCNSFQWRNVFIAQERIWHHDDGHITAATLDRWGHVLHLLDLKMCWHSFLHFVIYCGAKVEKVELEMSNMFGYLKEDSV